jgi:hypothetical protein
MEAKAIARKIGDPSEQSSGRIHARPNLFAVRLAMPLKNPKHLDAFMEGLRRAGLPEEPE